MTQQTAAMQAEKKQFYRDVIALVLPMAAQNLINVAVTSAELVLVGGGGGRGREGRGVCGGPPPPPATMSDHSN